MSWHLLHRTEDIEQIRQKSYEKPQALFKHSARCSISSIAKERIERRFDDLAAVADIHLIDVLKDRAVSNQVAEMFQVIHESPQMLVVQRGEAILEQAHYDVRVDEILDSLKKA